jgi:hypothetical protein
VFSDDVEITSGSVVNANSHVVNTIILINHGILNGYIFADEPPPIQFIVMNDGELNATFYLSPNSVLEQWISSASEMTALDVRGGGYVPVITNDFDGAVRASDLLGLHDGVRVEKDMLRIIAGVSELPDLASRLDIRNGAVIVISDYDGGDLRLSELDFNGGRVSYAIGGDLDAMFNYWIDGEEIKKLRETDYAVIFGPDDKRASFLNDLRLRDPENKILAKLDGAGTEGALLGAMENVMFFNPLILNDGLKRMASRPNFQTDGKIGFFVGARPAMDKTNYGSDIIFGWPNFSASFYIGRARENDDRKYGDATVFGIGADGGWSWIRAGARLMAADWKNVLIFTENGPRTDAKSRLFYSFLDFSPILGHIRPIVRLNYANSEAAGYSESDFYASYGGMAFLSDKNLGVEGTYGVYAMKNPGGIDFGVQADWHFAEDSLIVSLSAGPDNLSVEIRAGF